MFQINYYRLPSGEAPVETFIDSLSTPMKSKAIDSLELLREYGNTLRTPHSKPMGDGLFELRIRFSNDISRVFYFFCVDNIIILTNGFIKKTNQIPVREIERARRCKKDFEERSAHHG